MIEFYLYLALKITSTRGCVTTFDFGSKSSRSLGHKKSANVFHILMCTGYDKLKDIDLGISLLLNSWQASSLNAWPSDAVLCHRIWLTLVQVMACCLKSPSHYQSMLSYHQWGVVALISWLFHGNYTRYLSFDWGVGGAVRFLVVGTIGQEERPPRGQLWMEQCLTSLKYWPI